MKHHLHAQKDAVYTSLVHFTHLKTKNFCSAKKASFFFKSQKLRHLLFPCDATVMTSTGLYFSRKVTEDILNCFHRLSGTSRCLNLFNLSGHGGLCSACCVQFSFCSAGSSSPPDMSATSWFIYFQIAVTITQLRWET